MKKLIGLTMVMAMIMSMTGMAAFAATGELTASEKTDWFYVIENGSGQSLISHDGELIIHVSDKVPVFLEDGTPVRAHLAREALAEFLDGKKLTVVYSVATFSMPPMTTPVKIVIMAEGDAPVGIVPPIGTIPPKEAVILPYPLIAICPPECEPTPTESMTLFPLDGSIVVNGEIIEAPAPYYKGDVVMVPLHAIAEALGIDVTWDWEMNSVRLGAATHIWIGKDHYEIGKMVPIELGAAPEIVYGNIYVPMTFLGMILSDLDIYAFEGQIVVGPAGDML